MNPLSAEERASLARAVEAHLVAERAFGIDAYPMVETDGNARSIETAVVDQEPAMSPAPATSPDALLASVADQIANCTACKLCEGRTKVVPGQGSATARLMFVGEAPGYHEDQQGFAFVGRSGELLTKMIVAMGLSREDVFIGNVIKCRPPDNREPEAQEVDRCFRFIARQIDIIQPEVICTLGGVAANNLLNRDEPMYRLRGRLFDFRGAKLVPTYHPSYLLRTPEKKRDAWADLQVVMGLLGLDGESSSGSRP